MDDQLEALRFEALAAIGAGSDEAALEQARIKYLGQAGALTLISKGMRDVSKEDKPRLGKLLNDVRGAISITHSTIAHNADSGVSQTRISLCRGR